MKNDHADEAPLYPIGAVAERTGVPVNTLRTWERRYAVIEPTRTDSGARRYSEADIERVALIRRLSEGGMSVSALADHSTEALRAMSRRAPPESATDAAVVAVGPRLAARLAGESQLGGLRLAAVQPDADAERPEGPIDLLVVELESLGGDPAARLRGLLDRLGARRAIVSYVFARSEVRAALRAERGTLLREPYELAQLEAAARAAVGEAPATAVSNERAPAPRFTSAQLARLSDAQPGLACECPQHLSAVVAQLLAFERYSARCVLAFPADAEVHRRLESETSHARARMEALLSDLCELEGIDPG